MSRVPLRIDVDFRAGLVYAVPAMLDALARRDMRASFFVVAGCNPPVRSLTRLFDAGYRRRVVRLGLWRVPNLLGNGGGPMLEGPEVLDVVRRIEAEGHELVVHGWDHTWWAERVWRATTAELDEQIDRAYEAFESAVGAGAGTRAWGSPNWRTRDGVIAALAERGVPYFSECWGQAPFSSLGRPHLPVTDNLEARVMEHGPERQVVDEMLDVPRDYRLICAHDYFEGLLHPGLFAALLEALDRRGMRAVTLHAFAATLNRENLEPYNLERRPADGFCGDVSWQSGAPSRVLTSVG